mmetsp:Transcript_36603/g.84168  ORF Transcript_36603/g.84168 Transcript_36603/m.84168 type:complete len:96 (+) Transcript_36603:1049-1336(+)
MRITSMLVVAAIMVTMVGMEGLRATIMELDMVAAIMVDIMVVIMEAIMAVMLVIMAVMVVILDMVREAAIPDMRDILVVTLLLSIIHMTDIMLHT